MSESAKGKFLKVSCRDCGTETVIFSRAATAIACSMCGATIASPTGGKADLGGSSVVEILE